jgi:hypothetical protein
MDITTRVINVNLDFILSLHGHREKNPTESQSTNANTKSPPSITDESDLATQELHDAITVREHWTQTVPLEKYEE